MKSSWLTLISVSAAAVLALTACGGSSKSSSHSSASGSTSKAAVSTTLNASFGPVPAAIDPGNIANIDHNVYQPVLGVLVTNPPGSNGQFPATDQATPDLAQSWVRNADGSYTFTLRNMKSSAGNQLTSADVLWSFQRMLAINFISKLVLGVVGGNTSNPITVIDATHFTLNASSDNPNLLGALAQFEFGIVDSTATKAHATAADPWAKTWSETHLISYGAYTITNFTPNTEIDYAANPNYWDASNVYIKKIVDRGVADESTLLTLLKSGQLDFAANVAFSSMKSLASGGFRINSQPTALSLVIALDDRTAPFNNVQVRQAVSVALDRPAVAQGAFDGYATPSKSEISVAVAGTPTTAGTYFTYNPTLAKQLLSQAGYPSGFSFPMYYSAAAGTAAQDTAAATLIKQQLAAIGVTVNLMPIASAAQFSAGESAHSYKATMSEIGPLIPDIGYYVGLEWSTSTSLISPGYVNQQLISLNTQANTTTGSARTPILNQIMGIIDNDLPTLTVVDIPNQWAIKSDLTGDYSNGTQGLYSWLLKPS